MPRHTPWFVGLAVLAGLIPMRLLPVSTQHLYAMALFLYLPYLLGRHGSLTRVGQRTTSLLQPRQITSGVWGRHWSQVLLVNGALILPLFVVCFYLFRLLIEQRAFTPSAPSALWLAEQLLLQTLAVALPEEFFFRGFLTEAFEQRKLASEKNETDEASSESSSKTLTDWFLPQRVDIYANLFFAFAHVLTYGEPIRMIVFFPGLWYASLRRQSNSLLPSIVLHGASNVLMMILLGIAK